MNAQSIKKLLMVPIVVLVVTISIATICIMYVQAMPDDDYELGSIGSTGVTSPAVIVLPNNDEQGALGNTGVIDDRDWDTTAQGLLNHQAVIAYVEKNMSENGWNQAMQNENTQVYNLETRIGHEVDGYELAALSAQKEILAGTHNATEAESRLLEWARTQYDIPSNMTGINGRIVDIVGASNVGLVDEFISYVNNMTNHGNVSPDIRATDPDFWDMVGSLSLCGYIVDCDPTDLTRGNLDITSVTNFVPHWSDIRITYSPCETVDETCSEYRINQGTGITREVIAGPSHVQDWHIHVAMRGWGIQDSTIVVQGQVTKPVQGRALIGYDTDGIVDKSGYLYNPNARAESRAVITFTSYAYR